MFDQLRTDLLFAIRGQRKTPMMTAVLVGTLAFGIAATSLSFSLVNGFFIRPRRFRIRIALSASSTARPTASTPRPPIPIFSTCATCAAS